MKLYFLRHAEALDGADDAARPLTSHGEKQAREVGRFLERAGIEFDAVYCSPLVRAKQTAEGVLKICGSADLQIAEAFLNETSQAQFDKWLKEIPEVKHACLVGHAPSLGERICQLLAMTNPEALKLPKGGLACLETEDRHSAVLKFFVTPRLLGVKTS